MCILCSISYLYKISLLLHSPTEPLEWHHFLLVPIEPSVPMDRQNCPVTSQATWENNLSPLYEMHIHKQNHWNDIIFYWYQLNHRYQWTIGIALYPARPHERIIWVAFMWRIFTKRTTGMASIVLYPATPHERIIWVAFMWRIFTKRTTGMASIVLYPATPHERII